eukprot:GHVR01094166.1.p2 GENE.GHVR01094166.1~~GHVR01094166.1.p2  ORF type:complete len:110 (+),score=12.75 GHVR01094166.1:426-755(+)
MQKTADILFIVALSIIGFLMFFGWLLEDAEGALKVATTVGFFFAGAIFLIVMLWCLGQAIDLPSSTEKVLWIIGLLFASVIVVPYFFFTKARKKESNQPPQPTTASRRG